MPSEPSTTAAPFLTRVYISIRDIVLIYVDNDLEARTDDTAILKLVKAYGRVGGYSIRILGKGITTEFGARHPTSIQVMRYRAFKIAFTGYFAHILITPSPVGEQHWDVILTGLRISDFRTRAIPSSELKELVFELAAGVLRSL